MEQPQMVLQQPVAGQQMAPQPIFIPQNKVVSSKGFYITKIVFGCLSFTVSVIIVGIGGTLVTQYPYIVDSWIDLALSYPQAILAALWQTAEFITLCVRRDRGIHPGAHVALHLLIWLGCAVDASFLTIFAIEHGDCSDRYYCYRDFDGALAPFLGMEQALTALTFILLVIHFFLFVRACIECARRNSSNPTVVMVNSQPGMQPAVYYMPAAAPMQQQVYPQMQYMAAPPPQMPQHPPMAYSPPVHSNHTSTYGYPPPPQSVSEIQSSEPQQNPKAELDTNSSPVPAPAATPVSTAATHETYHSHHPHQGYTATS